MLCWDEGEVYDLGWGEDHCCSFPGWEPDLDVAVLAIDGDEVKVIRPDESNRHR